MITQYIPYDVISLTIWILIYQIIIEWTVSKNPPYPLVKVIAIKDLQVKGIAKYIGILIYSAISVVYVDLYH